MRAISEPVVETLRIGPDHWNDDGPYHISLTVTWLQRDEVKLSGLDKRLSGPAWRAVAAWARMKNIKRVWFIRKRDGIERRRCITVAKD